MTRSTPGVVSLIGLMTVLFFVFLISTAFVQEEKNTKEKESPANSSAMKAGKDPDGSIRRPTPAEEKKLNAELQKTLAKYPKQNAKQKADGSLSLVVAPHSFHAAVAHKGADGKVHLNCSDEAGHETTQVAPEKKSEE